MRAMILAAGRGERMRPLTDTTPKPLLKVAGKALISYHLKHLYQAGFRDIVINHAWLGQQIENTLGNGADYGLNIHYSPETTALETGGGIFQALPRLSPTSTEAFIVINGDIWCDCALDSLQLPPGKLAHLLLVDNPEHNPAGDFVLYDHHAYEKTTLPEHIQEQVFTFSGIGVYHPLLFNHCQAGAFPLAPLLKQAMHQHLVSAQHHDGLWMDIGTPERLARLDKLTSEAKK